MPTFKFKSWGLMALTLLPLSLTACGGEGWQIQKTTTTFPYGNQRTAGSGVEYVRASMMPAKGPVVIPKEEPPVVKAPEPAPAPAPEEPPAVETPKPADKVFNDLQRK